MTQPDVWEESVIKTKCVFCYAVNRIFVASNGFSVIFSSVNIFFHVVVVSTGFIITKSMCSP